MPACAAEATPRYRPRAASNALKEIVEDSLEELLRSWDARFAKDCGPLPRRLRGQLEAFLRCGDAHFGFLRLRCVSPECTQKQELILPFSCKVRGLCPSCGQRRAIQWAERMVEEVLPVVPYRQLVFTIPRRLRKYFLFDRSLYGDLCRAAYASTRDFLRKQTPAALVRLKRAVPAMVVVPQSFADLLVPHAHAHAICSLGLFSPDGTFHRMEDVDFSGLEAVFRERVLGFMVKRGKITPEVAEAMRAWPHSGFQVNFQRKLERDDRKGLERLLTYMDRPAVSLRRLTYRDDGKVHYQGTRFHPRLGTDHQLLSPVEFMALVTTHVLLRYQVTLRSYGAASTTFRKKAGWIERPPVDGPPRSTFGAAALPAQSPPAPVSAPVPAPPGRGGSREEESDFLKSRKRNWARLIHKTWLVDPCLCSSCHKPMKILAAISSPEQDDVIERILRARGAWDPPWQRAPRARGPPPPEPSTRVVSGETIDPQLDADDYYERPVTREDS